MVDQVHESAVTFHDYDPARNLDTPEAVAEFLAAALEGGDMKHFARAVGIASRAVGMTDMAQKTGISRSGLYDLLDGKSAPRSDSLFKVIEALGVKLTVVA
ncbi:addiction module antidote protein [uncultured Algimonas sp.]|uniref:addiction module antidote protein n=1 Tax=uncultured Algimonas sp. TaxID=1547920 RepID=UPI00260EB1D4|nr:addiction module antidote protein [uncultured Algimonas sp.]